MRAPAPAAATAPSAAPSPAVAAVGRAGPIPVIGPAAGREGGLFPYVYMRTWPEPSEEAEDIHFVRYPDGLDAPYIQEMESFARPGTPDGREQMEKRSVEYLESLQLGRGARSAAALLASAGDALAPLLDATSARRAARAEGGDAVAFFATAGPSGASLEGYASSADCTSFLVRVWQAYVALVVELGYAPRLRDELARILVVDHLLTWPAKHPDVPPSPELYRALSQATIVLPGAIFPLPPAGTVPSHPAAGEWITLYAIGDLQMVKQRLVRYALGDLARVESVMAGERRESVRRTASRVTESSTRRATDQSTRGLDARNETQRGTIGEAIADIVSTTTYGSASGADPFVITYAAPVAPSTSPTTTLTGGWSRKSSRRRPSRGAAPRRAR